METEFMDNLMGTYYTLQGIYYRLWCLHAYIHYQGLTNMLNVIWYEKKYCDNVFGHIAKTK